MNTIQLTLGLLYIISWVFLIIIMIKEKVNILHFSNFQICTSILIFLSAPIVLAMFIADKIIIIFDNIFKSK